MQKISFVSQRLTISPIPLILKDREYSEPGLKGKNEFRFLDQEPRIDRFYLSLYFPTTSQQGKVVKPLLHYPLKLEGNFLLSNDWSKIAYIVYIELT